MSAVAEFYRGRTLFVTGGTGFMGKVLLEKLLRSLPEIKQIYILLRPKHGLTPSERIAAITNKPPFTLKNLGEDDFKKLIAVHGDTSQEGLGLSHEDKMMLINEVSVVFHLAASVRMNLSLKQAIQQNTLSTLRVFNLCEEIKNLKSVVYSSTAYCNVEIDYMEEKIYNTNVDPYKIMDFVQWIDDESLNRIQQNIMKPHPNSYTFSKRLSEIVAWDMGKKLPIVICRPSIVTASLKEPTPGWIDNFNGPVGLMIAAGKGAIRSALVNRACIPQVVPVDIAINSMITCGWFRTTTKFAETPIYNVTQAHMIKMNWGDICDKYRKLIYQYPYKRFLWRPVCKETTNIWLHYLIVLLFHMIPAYVIDFLLIIFMQKPFMVRLQNKLNNGMEVLRYFAMRHWSFTNTKLMEIKEALSQQDWENFYLFEENLDVDKYLCDTFFGSRKYCIKESWENLFYQKVIYKIMFCLEYVGNMLLVYPLLWVFLHMFDATYLLAPQYWRHTTSNVGSTKI